MYAHTHTHLRIEFIRVNSAAGTRRERERESTSNRYRRAGICSAAGYNEKITAFAAIICTRAHVHRRRCGVCERERTREEGGYVRATTFIISSPSGTRPARIKRGASTRVTRLLPATPITQTPPRGLSLLQPYKSLFFFFLGLDGFINRPKTIFGLHVSFYFIYFFFSFKRRLIL